MRTPRTSLRLCCLLTILAVAVLLIPTGLALAVPMQNDPNGFDGIPWGRRLPNRIGSSRSRMQAGYKASSSTRRHAP